MKKFIAILLTLLFVSNVDIVTADCTTAIVSKEDTAYQMVTPIDNGDGSQSLGGVSWYLSYYYSHLDGEDTLAKDYGKNREPEAVMGNTHLSEEDYSILLRIVEAEATGGTIENKRNVASCVLTRVNSSDWPNSVKDVVFQKGQFAPIRDGRYYTVTITNSTIEAVSLTLQEGLINDCTFFCTRTCDAYKQYEKGTNWWYRELYEVKEIEDSMHAFFKERRERVE